MNGGMYICSAFEICFIVFCNIVTEVEREENRSKELVKKEVSEGETEISRKDKKVEVSERVRQLICDCQVLRNNAFCLESDRFCQGTCLLLFF